MSSYGNLLFGVSNQARGSRSFYTGDNFAPNSAGLPPAHMLSGGLQKGRVGWEAEELAAHRLQVGLAPLELLGHGVDVPEATLEGLLAKMALDLAA